MFIGGVTSPPEAPLAPLYVRPWTLNGMSPQLIESHYEINYGSTVRRLNDIAAQLDGLDRAATPPDWASRLASWKSTNA